MGFGLLSLGYIFLNFYLFGADLIGYIIMLFALLKLIKIEESFKKCILAIVILIPVGMFNMFGFVDLAFDLDILTVEKIESVAENSGEVSSENSALSEDVASGAETSSQNTESINLEEEYFKNESEVVDGGTVRSNGARIAEAIFNAVFIFGSLTFHYFFYQSAKKLCIKTGAAKLFGKANRNMLISIVFFCAWGLLTAGGGNVAVINIITLLHYVVLILNFIYIYSCYATFTYESQDERDEDENE